MGGFFFLSGVCKLTKGLWMLPKNEVWNTVVDVVVVGVTVVILTKRWRHKEMKELCQSHAGSKGLGH